MYSESEKALIKLNFVESISNNKIDMLLSIFQKPERIFDNYYLQKSQIVKIIGNKNYEKLEKVDDNLFNNFLRNLEEQNIKIVTSLSENYPQKLKNIIDKPFVLYYKGDLSLIDEKGIAVVGTRNPSMYGRVITEKFVEKLAQSGVVIISGLASGVDKISHEIALKVGGKTIAVLGGGFNNIYPAMNVNLAKEVVEKGLIITEYKPDMRPTVYTFPYRNRIIAGVSDGVLITEAGEKSGALYTKNYAIEYGKEIFAIPGNINNEKCKGTNRILKNLQGCMVTEPQDILIRLGLNFIAEKPKVIQGDMNEQLILDALDEGEQTLEKLQEITKLETKILNSCLTIMQIRGLIKKLPGNSYIK